MSVTYIKIYGWCARSVLIRKDDDTDGVGLFCSILVGYELQ